MGVNTAGDTAADGATEDAPAVRVVPGSLDERILDATVRCVARFGVGKTTLDDIAREAGCSRASIYRAVPGGKRGVLVAAARHERDRVLAALDARLAACDDLADALTVLVGEGARLIATHEAVGYLVAHEPEVILPHVSFDGLEPILAQVAEFASPHLGRFLEPTVAWRTGEWMARLVTSYAFDEAAPIDLTDPACARRVVDTYVMAGLSRHVREAPSLSAPA